jgi:diguanylate cyclase (GGDEF)-like protein
MPLSEIEARLSPHEIRLLADIGEKVELEAGQVLFRRGDVSDALYVIEDGSIRLDFGEGKKSKSLGPNDLFGEMFLGYGSRRTADATAETNVTVRRIDRARVDQLKHVDSHLLCTLLQGTCSTLLASETELVESLRKRNHELERALDFLRRTRQDLSREGLLARTDETTGLYNKRCLHEQFENFAQRAQRTAKSLVMLWIDLDDFKDANSISYEIGDAVLARVGDILREETRASDLPCRWGGDEFCVVMSAIEPGKGTAEARRVHAAISDALFRHGADEIVIRASIGGAEMTADDTLEALQRRANESLLQAKRSGKNRIVWEGRLITS